MAQAFDCFFNKEPKNRKKTIYLRGIIRNIKKICNEVIIYNLI